MRYTWKSRTGRLLAILLLAVVSALLVVAPARADGVTVTLSTANGSSFTYNGTPPSFTVVVTFTTKPTINNCGGVTIQFDSGQSAGSSSNASVSPDGLTWTYTRISPPTALPAGQRSAVATFLAPGASCTSVQSAPMSFTVNKAILSLACGGDVSGATLVGVGQTLHVQMAPGDGNGQLPAEWLGGTYNITFYGPSPVTYSNLTSDSNYVVTVTAPSQIGSYTRSCTFNGSANYAPTTMTTTNPFLVGLLHSLGTVQLFTNPTTLVAGKNLDFYVAFHPASGLPMPAGQFSIWIGNYYTNAITLGPTGDYLIHLSPLPSLAGVSRIEIFYMGDKYYKGASVYFPLTNPPIPSGTTAGGSGNGSLGAGNNSQGTATTQGTPSATATGDATTPTVAGAGVGISYPPQQGNSDGLPLILILVLVGLMIAGGAVVGVIYLMRRRANSLAGVGGPLAGEWDAPDAPPYSQQWNPPEQQWNLPGQQWNDDTYPYKRGDR